MRARILSIVGSGPSGSRYSDEVQQMAEWAGAAAARAGWIVQTGGHGGVMTDAARGAKRGGGTTIGILTTLEHERANDFIDIVLPTPLGIARNILTASMCHRMLALPGGLGTLQELTFAMDYGRPVCSWDSWEFPDRGVEALARSQKAAVLAWLDDLLPPIAHRGQKE